MLHLPSPVQKSVPKGVEVAEGLFGIHCERVARDDSLHLSVHDGSEAVGGRLRSNSAAREVLLQEVPEEFRPAVLDQYDLPGRTEPGGQRTLT